MKTSHRLFAALVVVVGPAILGCALTQKGDALTVRYFSPETVKAHVSSTADPRPADAAIAIELGRVTSGINLRDKIAFRDATYEVGFYDDKRWTERPEVYVRRELARTLYEEHGLRRAIGGGATVLDVEVVAFEELRNPSARAARVQLRILVHDAQRVFLQRTITVDRPVAAGASGFDGLVQAMAEALDLATEEVAAETEKAERAAATTRTSEP